MSHNHVTSETEYFYKLNRELISENRKKLDKERSEQANLEMKKQHWMKCPKCGHDLKEIELSGLKIDKCGSCHGLFFDNGELELLMQSQKPEGFIGSLKNLFTPK